MKLKGPEEVFELKLIAFTEIHLLIVVNGVVKLDKIQ